MVLGDKQVDGGVSSADIRDGSGNRAKTDALLIENGGSSRNKPESDSRRVSKFAGRSRFGRFNRPGAG